MLYLIAHQPDCSIVRFGPTFDEPLDAHGVHVQARSRTCTCGGQVIEVREGEPHDRDHYKIVGRVLDG